MWWLVLIIIGIIAFFMVLNRNAAADEAQVRKKRLKRIAEGDYEFILEEHRQRQKRRADEVERCEKMLLSKKNDGEPPQLDYSHPTTELVEIARQYPNDVAVSELIQEIEKTNDAMKEMRGLIASLGSDEDDNDNDNE